MNNWNPNDTVYFLDEYRLSRGTVVSVGPVNLKIEIMIFQADCSEKPYHFSKPHTKCAHPDEQVAIIHEQWKGRNGRGGYRLDREQYTDDLIPAKDWMSQRKFDPVKETAEL